MAEKIEKWYQLGLWTHSMVRQAVEKGVLSREDGKVILQEENDE